MTEEKKVLDAKLNLAVNTELGAIEVKCQFPGSDKAYSFRSVLDGLKKGDFVVAMSTKGLTLVKVAEVGGPITLELEEQMVKIKYDSLNWIVGTVNIEGHSAVLKVEKSIKAELS